MSKVRVVAGGGGGFSDQWLLSGQHVVLNGFHGIEHRLGPSRTQQDYTGELPPREP